LAGDFFAADFLLDFLAADFLAGDFFAADFLLDFLAAGILPPSLVVLQLRPIPFRRRSLIALGVPDAGTAFNVEPASFDRQL
jgi:hypothetical protein